MSREGKIRKASWISVVGNSILSVLKIVVGIVSGSLAVLADGIDSATDVVASVVTLVAAKIMSKPPDLRYSYGYIRADTIATKLLSFIIFFAGAQLAIYTASDLIEGNVREIPSMIAIYVTVFSIAGKLLLAFHQRVKGKELESFMLRANGTNMQNDVLISLSVLIGLIFTHVFDLPIIDPVIALAVSCWIMYSAFRIFMRTSTELMDGVDDPEMYTKIFDAVNQVEGAINPHRARIRKMGNSYVVGIDIEVDGSISVDESHKIAQQVEDNIKRSLPNVYDILVHVEPIGEDRDNEKFGVSEKDI